MKGRIALGRDPLERIADALETIAKHLEPVKVETTHKAIDPAVPHFCNGEPLPRGGKDGDRAIFVDLYGRAHHVIFDVKAQAWMFA